MRRESPLSVPALQLEPPPILLQRVFDEVVQHQRPWNVQQPPALVDPPEQDRREAGLFGQRLHGRARSSAVPTLPVPMMA